MPFMSKEDYRASSHLWMGLAIVMTLGCIILVTVQLSQEIKIKELKTELALAKSAKIQLKTNSTTREFRKNETLYQGLLEGDVKKVKERYLNVVPVLTRQGKIEDNLGPGDTRVPLWVVEEHGKTRAVNMTANRYSISRAAKGHCQFAEGPDTCNIEAVREFVFQKWQEWARERNYEFAGFVEYDTTSKIPSGMAHAGTMTHESRLFIGMFLAPMK